MSLSVVGSGTKVPVTPQDHDQEIRRRLKEGDTLFYDRDVSVAWWEDSPPGPNQYRECAFQTRGVAVRSLLAAGMVLLCQQNGTTWKVELQRN